MLRLQPPPRQGVLFASDLLGELFAILDERSVFRHGGLRERAIGVFDVVVVAERDTVPVGDVAHFALGNLHLVGLAFFLLLLLRLAGLIGLTLFLVFLPFLRLAASLIGKALQIGLESEPRLPLLAHLLGLLDEPIDVCLRHSSSLARAAACAALASVWAGGLFEGLILAHALVPRRRGRRCNDRLRCRRDPVLVEAEQCAPIIYARHLPGKLLSGLRRRHRKQNSSALSRCRVKSDIACRSSPMLGMIEIGLVERAALHLVDRAGVAVPEILECLGVEFDPLVAAPVESSADPVRPRCCSIVAGRAVDEALAPWSVPVNWIYRARQNPAPARVSCLNLWILAEFPALLAHSRECRLLSWSTSTLV